MQFNHLLTIYQLSCYHDLPAVNLDHILTRPLKLKKISKHFRFFDQSTPLDPRIVLSFFHSITPQLPSRCCVDGQTCTNCILSTLSFIQDFNHLLPDELDLLADTLQSLTLKRPHDSLHDLLRQFKHLKF